MKKLIQPKKLSSGNKVAAISLSWGGGHTFPWKYNKGTEQLESLLDVEVVPTKNALRDADWLWRNPQARADDLMQAFSDPDIKAIFSIIGGSESVRILPYLDLNVIANNPKIFMGFSDTTVTHFACFKAGISSFYGPSIMAGFDENGGLFPYMASSVKKFLTTDEAPGVWKPNADGWVFEQLNWEVESNTNIPRILNVPTEPRYLQGSKVVQGRLLGGCMDVLEFLKGTDYWPSLEEWEGAILFLETCEEGPSPESVTRWLRNYASQGILYRLKGIIFGRPAGVKPETFSDYDACILKVVRDEFGLKEIPIVTMLDFGHTGPVSILPYGALVEIDPITKNITFKEGATS